MDSYFPKDCRESYQRGQLKVKVAFIVMGAATALLVLDWCLHSDTDRFVLLFVSSLALGAVAMWYLSRCPACGGLPAYKTNPRYCGKCGSRLSVSYCTADEDSMMPSAATSAALDRKSGINILEETPERWRFRFKAGHLRLIGAAIVVAGIAWAAQGDSLVIHCRRTNVGQTHAEVRSTFLGLHVGSRTVRNIKAAQLGVSHSGKGGASYRVELITSGGAVPLTHVSTPGFARHQQTVETINEFVQNGTRFKAEVFQLGSLADVIPPGLLLLVGIALTINRRDEFLFDLRNHRFEVLRRGWGKGRLLQYSLDVIDRFGVVRTKMGSNRKGKGEAYLVGMLLKSGAIVHLLRSYSPGGCNEKQAIANALEQYRRSFQKALPGPRREEAGPTFSLTQVRQKICCLCGESCADQVRYQDPDGRCYHKACYDRMVVK
jgi:hypothetical protein